MYSMLPLVTVIIPVENELPEHKLPEQDVTTITVGVGIIAEVGAVIEGFRSIDSTVSLGKSDGSRHQMISSVVFID